MASQRIVDDMFGDVTKQVERLESALAANDTDAVKALVIDMFTALRSVVSQFPEAVASCDKAIEEARSFTPESLGQAPHLFDDDE